MTTYTRYPRAILWLVPGGSATVGGPEENAKPSFRVEFGSFYLSKTPITNRQFEAFDADFNRLASSPGDDDPAVGVSFDAAAAYCEWYAGVARKPIRLPTETEWEYACRGGTATRYFFGDDPSEADPYLWDRENCAGMLPLSTQKKPNPFGLLGMLGGVWEWTSSQDRPYPVLRDDGRDDLSGSSRRILRGGSFRTPRKEIGCGVRRGADPGAVLDDVGFRIMREFPRTV